MEDTIAPTLKILLPGQSNSDPGVQIEFPEHVTGVHDKNIQKRLYLNTWPRLRPVDLNISDNQIEYKRLLRNKVKFTAKATVESNGIRISYHIENNSNIDYDNFLSVTCVKQFSLFEDNLLERMYVHHKDGFDLLASEHPERLSMGKGKLNFYFANHNIPLPKEIDNTKTKLKSKLVDLPFLASLSKNKDWIIATYSKDVDNLWSNPTRTCQHADPTGQLPKKGALELELKIFVIKGNLNDLLSAVELEENS